jgi:hypothetical protein
MRKKVMRKKVAKACGWPVLVWDPEHSEVLWKALVRKIAELIEKRENTGKTRSGRVKYEHTLWRRLGKALSTGSTNDLEALCYELLEASNG